MSFDSPVARYLILLSLGFFFGLAFEEFHAHAGQQRPGGVRTFPLLALTGALLYQLDPARCLPLCAGLLVLGAWLAAYYWHHTDDVDADGAASVGLMVPVCSLLAFLLGPATLSQPPWVAVGATVAAVLFLTGREKLHGLARQVETSEIVTAGKFLMLTGLILPLLPDRPVTPLTDITPHQVWLAVLAVTTVSYASYLLQKYIAPTGGGLWVAVLGGFYSSTATTVVLARRAGAEPAALLQAQTGIILATSVMYLRLLVIILVFDRPLALTLLPFLLALSAAGLGMAGLRYTLGGGDNAARAGVQPSGNPLELGTAAVFATLFLAISLATAWAQARYGASGIYILAAIVGVSDIDPFVLSLAQHGAGDMTVTVAAVAVLIAISSNNLLKTGYAISFAGWRRSLVPAAALVGLAIAGGGAAALLAAYAP